MTVKEEQYQDYLVALLEERKTGKWANGRFNEIPILEEVIHEYKEMFGR